MRYDESHFCSFLLCSQISYNSHLCYLIYKRPRAQIRKKKTRTTKTDKFGIRLGGVITVSRTPPASYCTNATFISNFNTCMECANTYNVWSSYGNSVTNGAKACNITANPSPSSAVSGAAATGSANSTSSSNRTASGTITSTGSATGAATGSASGTASRSGSAAGASATSSSAGNTHSIAGLAGIILMGFGLFY